MLKDIQSVFLTLIDSLTWMDDATKENTVDKAQSVTHEIGYADWVMNGTKVEEYYKDVSLASSQNKRI